MDDLVKRLRDRDIAAWDDAYSCRARGTEAADAIEALQARVAEKDAEIARLREAIDGAAFQITVLANRLETHEDDMASPSREFSSRLRDTAIRAMKGSGTDR